MPTNIINFFEQAEIRTKNTKSGKWNFPLVSAFIGCAGSLASNVISQRALQISEKNKEKYSDVMR